MHTYAYTYATRIRPRRVEIRRDKILLLSRLLRVTKPRDKARSVTDPLHPPLPRDFPRVVAVVRDMRRCNSVYVTHVRDSDRIAAGSLPAYLPTCLFDIVS